MRNARAALTLVRIDASIVIFLSIFVPTLTRTNNLQLSLGKAAPMLFVGFCTWIANDIDDLERDRINHPDRPLPSGRISLETASALFFLCLVLALAMTYYLIDSAIAFWYYLVLILSLSYGYIVELAPAWKAPYVAAAMAIPTIIVANSYPNELHLWRVAVAVFCFALGKELYMDLLDRPGDTPSFLHVVRFEVVARMAFGVLWIGLTFLVTYPRSARDVMYATVMVGLLLFATVIGERSKRHRLAVQIVRIEMLLGIYYLV